MCCWRNRCAADNVAIDVDWLDSLPGMFALAFGILVIAHLETKYGDRKWAWDTWLRGLLVLGMSVAHLVERLGGAGAARFAGFAAFGIGCGYVVNKYYD